ncbi:hypothetical protein [Francisella philomiragia]|uniref:hypothetical protein n=1 Tax=Francisella philomiragia TaxID=28110 RepID=UPI0019090223|nr:hypothetical protein [Francisella philomiragia]MBK2257565.1 hypothetical protein [Francisella philomiragia]MBK2270273.1 hypothetical protein [Francisella philomiragia]MBK2272119.1 hypothetical protein [Francisella philomiragia]MBK2275958.1 hypothetical protein [Francisella philomiragia]MBK2295459.1 hypothetical protein [Francisella philomiragia]
MNKLSHEDVINLLCFEFDIAEVLAKDCKGIYNIKKELSDDLLKISADILSFLKDNVSSELFSNANSEVTNIYRSPSKYELESTLEYDLECFQLDIEELKGYQNIKSNKGIMEILERAKQIKI